MDNNKQKHLEFIQNNISRLANHSFLIKGWAVTLIAGIFALSSKESNQVYFIVAYIPILMFWCLDAYYLLEERLFRALYDKVRKTESQSVDYCMDITNADLHLSPNTYYDCWKSKSILCFYLPLALLTITVTLLSTAI